MIPSMAPIHPCVIAAGHASLFLLFSVLRRPPVTLQATTTSFHSHKSFLVPLFSFTCICGLSHVPRPVALGVAGRMHTLYLLLASIRRHPHRTRFAAPAVQNA